MAAMDELPNFFQHLQGAVWEFEKGPGWWEPMDAQFSSYLTRELSAGKGGVVFDWDYGSQATDWEYGLVGFVEYTISFETFTQTNNRNGSVRRIRVVVYSVYGGQ